MDPSAWIATVTALGGLVKAWIDARKSGIDLQVAKLEIAKQARVSEQASPTSSKAAILVEGSLVIDEELLSQLVADIVAANKRFASVLNDPRYTPADIDREQESARLSACSHIERIRNFNAGVLPTKELENFCLSFRCSG